MTAPLPHVAVLGAGVCGLAAALELRRAGLADRVTVLEADARPGGLARSVYDPSGLQSDLGPHRIHTELPEAEALLGEITDAEDIHWVDRRSAMWINGTWVDYPFGLRGVIGTFGLPEFVRMGLSAVWAKVGGLGWGEGENFEEHMERAFGRRIYRRVLQPYTHKVWKTDPTDISVEAAKVRVSAGSVTKLARRILTGGRERAGEETALKRFRYIRGGVETLVKRLAGKVEAAGGVIQCESRIESLAPAPAGVWTIRHSRGETEATDLISTIPVNRLPGLLEGGPEPPREAMDALEYLEIVLVFLTLKKPQVSENHWLYFPEEHLAFNRAYEPGRFWRDPDAPQDKTLLTVELTARQGSGLAVQSDEDLTRQVVEGLETTGLISADEVEKSLVVRLSHGYPLYDCRSDGNLARVLEHLGHWPSLVTAGRQGLFSHNNMDHSLVMGLRAARALAGGPESVARWHREAESLRHFRIVD